MGICTWAESSSIFPTGSSDVYVIIAQVCLCFYSSLKIQSQEGHSYPSLRGRDKKGRGDGINNSGGVLNSFCQDLTCLFVWVWVCMRVEARGQTQEPLAVTRVQGY